MPTNVMHKIDAWWTAFTARAGDLNDLFANRRKWDLPEWMHEHLGAVHERLMWEFGPAVQGQGHA